MRLLRCGLLTLLCCWCVALLSLVVDSTVTADERPLFVSRHVDPSIPFAPAIPKWELVTGSPESLKHPTEGKSDVHVLVLKPEESAVELLSPALPLGKEIAADQPWHLEVMLNNLGVSAGRFSVELLCCDAQDKTLRTMTLASFAAGTSATAWRRTVAQFGPESTRPYPEGTVALKVRLLFAEIDGECRGEVHLKRLLLKPAQVPGNADWPRDFVVNSGDLQTRFESRSFWTPYRIEYRGKRLGVDRFGSHYGTTINFPGTGFIGSGHTENADELVHQIALTVDGKPVAIPPAEITANKMELRKQSQIRDLHLQTVVTVENNRLREAVTLTATEPTPINVAYHFMHPWAPTARHFLGELQDGTELQGEFVGDRKHRFEQPTRWTALFDEALGTGAVTYVVQAPTQPGHWQTNYWDIDEVYRKHYFVTFKGQTIPVGEKFRYEVITAPFAATLETWKAEARQLARQLASEQKK